MTDPDRYEHCPACNNLLTFVEVREGGEYSPFEEVWYCLNCSQAWLFDCDTAADLSQQADRLAAWVSQFEGLHLRTQDLWKAIKQEFDEQQPPMTVRQMFYRMSSGGHVEKTENGYRQVQRCLLEMRRKRAIPYSYIADNTRWVRQTTSYRDLADAAGRWQSNYRRDLWASQPVHIEIWLEKDALAGVLFDVTGEYNVPLYVTRGYSSETFLYEAAENLKAFRKNIYIYHFGDFDPSGRDAARDIAAKLAGFGAQFQFVEAAVVERQVREMNLPTRPTKKSDARAKSWIGGESVELDAIPPATLRQMVRNVIEQHIDQHALHMTRMIEQQEKDRIAELMANFGTSPKF